MCGTIGTARQASAGGHARHTAAADRTEPVNGTARQPASAVRVPPLTDPQGNDVTGRWPLRSFLELGSLPSAIPCARLHTRQLLWEWQLTVLSDTAELLVSELVTNAVQITQAGARNAPVRLWLATGPGRWHQPGITGPVFTETRTRTYPGFTCSLSEKPAVPFSDNQCG